MLKTKEYYIAEILKVYRSEWEKYDKSLLIEQCYDLGYTTKRDIQKLELKSKEDLIDMLVKQDEIELNNTKEWKLSDIIEEYNSFKITYC